VSKRLAYLEKSVASGSKDPFVWYGLAQEYRTLERHEDALKTFTSLREASPDYVPMYLMCGQLLEKMGRAEDAKGWLLAGIAAAKKKGDAHAQGELESALAALPES
jgi:predicted Zn-dependent protease